MKQVWILNHYAQEPNGAGGTRHFHLAEHLRLKGWQATIIAASVDHVTGQQRLTESEFYRRETIQGVTFLWIRTPCYSGNGSSRMRNMLTYAVRALQRNITNELTKPDVIIGSSVHPFAAVSGALLARRFKVPFVFEVRDLWPQTLIDMGRLRGDAFITRALQRLERWLYRRAARIVVLLPDAWRYIEPLGISRAKIEWIPNGFDVSLFPSPGAPRKETRCSEEDFVIMYFGAHGQANDLEPILQAAHIIQESNTEQTIRLRMIGDGPLKPKLKELASTLRLNNVDFEDPIPKNMISRTAADADAFIVSIKDLPNLYRFGISLNKIFDYLASARPIIIACNLEGNPIEEARAGLTVKASDPKDIARGILQLSKMPTAERRRMGEAGRQFVEQNYDFTVLAEKLADLLDSVVEEQGQTNLIKPAERVV